VNRSRPTLGRSSASRRVGNDADPSSRDYGNTLDNFRLVFDREFEKTLIGRMQGNEAIVSRVLDDEEFRRTLIELYATRVYRRARGD